MKPYKLEDYTKEELVELCKLLTKQNDFLKTKQKYLDIFPISKMYSEDRVDELLDAQRGNCWVALRSAIDQGLTKEEMLKKVGLAPQPGGEQWRKSLK